MRKIFHQLHLWLSIPFGIIISIICFTGATLVFETEIMEALYPERYYVEQSLSAPLPMEQLLNNVASTLPDTVSISGVTVSADPEKAYQVMLSKPRRASLYLNQYTGEVIGYNKRGAFFTFMFRAHRWLLDTVVHGHFSWGKTLVGVSTLAFVFIILSGVVIWVPRSRKALKNRLSIKTNKGWRRFWFDLHVSGGIYATVILLALALTGLTWSFPWYRTGFYKVFGVEMAQGTPQHAASQHGKPQDGKSQGGKPNGAAERGGRGGFGMSPFRSWQKAYEAVIASNSDFRQINISKDGIDVAIRGWGNQRGADRYTFDRKGEITGVQTYKDQDKAGKLRGWIYSVHVGNWGGWFTRILTFLAALMGAVLPMTGYYLWLKKKKPTKEKNMSTPGK